MLRMWKEGWKKGWMDGRKEGSAIVVEGRMEVRKGEKKEGRKKGLVWKEGRKEVRFSMQSSYFPPHPFLCKASNKK